MPKVRGGGEGEGRRREGWVLRFARIWGQILNAHSSKTVRARPINMVLFRINRPCSIDWNRFQSSTTTYKGDSGLRSGFGPWTTEKGWK